MIAKHTTPRVGVPHLARRKTTTYDPRGTDPGTLLSDHSTVAPSTRYQANSRLKARFQACKCPRSAHSRRRCLVSRQALFFFSAILKERIFERCIASGILFHDFPDCFFAQFRSTISGGNGS